MKCQFCHSEDSRVVDSRPTDDGASIRRRRECIACGKRFTTYEKVETVQLLVIKKDQTREVFDAGKIRAGIVHACHKRPVTAGISTQWSPTLNRFATIACSVKSPPAK